VIRVESRSASADPEAFDRTFCELPGAVRRDPYRVALLPAGLTHRMLGFPLPKPAERFLALAADGGTIGRIGANLSPVHEGLAYVGFFEVDVARYDAGQAASRLLHEAAEWARGLGATRLVGPVDFSTWFAYRLAVNRDSTVPAPRLFSWEPVNPPEYPVYFCNFGMGEVQAYHSQGYSAAAPDDYLPGYGMLKRAYDFALGRGFTIRPLDPGRDLSILHRMSHSTFSDAFLFEPLPFPMFAAVYAAALQGYDFSPSRIAEGPEGEPAGFLFAFFDGDHLIIKTVAVLPEFRNMMLSSALLCPVAEAARSRGVRHGVSALIRSGGTIEQFERRSEREAGGTFWRHDYALFGKDL
jgi:GNAT superfamily N-acetyltransferase